MALEEVDLELTGESLITYRGDDLNLRSEDFKYDVETDLVITSTGTSVCNCTGAKLLYMLENLECLEYSLRAH